MADDLDIRLTLSGARAFINNTREAAGAVEHIGTAARRAGAQQTAMGRRTAALNQGLSKHASTLRKVGGALAATGAGYLAFSKAKDAVQTTQQLGIVTLRLHRNLGLTTKSAAQWATILKARNISPDAAQMSFTKFSSAVEQARKGSKTAVDQFQKLGISQKDLKQGDFNSLLLKTADGFGKLHGGVERQSAAIGLLGRGWKTILPLFSKGSKTLREQQKLSDPTAQNIVKTLPNVRKMIAAEHEWQFASLRLKTAVGAALLPELTKLADKGSQLLDIFQNPHLTIGQKWAKADKQIINPLMRSLEQGIERAAPQIASHAGQLGVAMAKGMIRGFAHADPLGQAVILGILGKKLGVFSLLGSMAGKRFAGGFGRSPSTVAGGAEAAGAGAGVRGASTLFRIAGPVAITAMAGIELGVHSKEIRNAVFSALGIHPPGAATPRQVRAITRDPTGLHGSQQRLLRQFRQSGSAVGTHAEAAGGAGVARTPSGHPILPTGLRGSGVALQNKLRAGTLSVGRFTATLPSATNAFRGAALKVAGVKTPAGLLARSSSTAGRAISTMGRSTSGVAVELGGLKTSAKTAKQALDRIPGIGVIPALDVPVPGAPAAKPSHHHSTRSGGGTSGQGKFAPVEEHHHHIHIDGREVFHAVSRENRRKAARR